MDFEHWLQSRLTAHGFPVGEIDGVIGAQTIAALRAFQSKRGIEVTGKADGTTVEFLRYPSSTIMPEIKAELPDRDKAPAETIQPSKTVWPRQADVSSFFGKPGDMANMTSIEAPYEMVLAWDKSAKVRKITLHKKVAPSAERVLRRVAGLYTATERKDLGLNLFGGSLNVRRMRGGTAYSMHSWAIAIDFNPEANQLSWHKPKASLSHIDALPFWQEWEAEGWVSLGRARDFDWMHVQAARL